LQRFDTIIHGLAAGYTVNHKNATPQYCIPPMSPTNTDRF